MRWLAAALPRLAARRSGSRRSPGRWTYLAICGAAIVATILPILAQPSLLVIARDQLFDAYQRAAPRAWDRAEGVRIVDIDDRSLEQLGQWPWPRTRLAALLDRLRAAGVAGVAFDIAFAEADRTSLENIVASLPDGGARTALASLQTGSSNDSVFAEAVRSTPVVLGIILSNDAPPHPLPAKRGIATIGSDVTSSLTAFRAAVVPISTLGDASAGLGALNWVPDRDLTVRRVPLLYAAGGTIVPSLGLETLRVALGTPTIILKSETPTDGRRGALEAIRVGDVTIPTNAKADLRIRFSLHDRGRFLSAADVLSGRVDPDELTDRLVLIGSSAAGLVDIRATPVDPAMPGIEVQAQSLENILAGTALHRPDFLFGAEIIVGILLAALVATFMPRLSATVGFALVIGLAAAVVATSFTLFRLESLLVDPLAPGLPMLAVYLAGSALLFKQSQQERRWIGEAFGRFVAPEVIERLSADRTALALGGEMRTITVLFSDLKGFTGITERLNASELTDFVNAYLSPMSRIVLDQRGTIGKYIGDAVMAFWNAPLDDEHHARHAVRAAAAMLAALPRIEATWTTPTDGQPPRVAGLRCGIGIATGLCAVGNFGSDVRFEYSAMGDTVNVAARLEAATRRYGLDVLATEDTMMACGELDWLEVDVVRLHGKSQATRLMTPLLPGDLAIDDVPLFKRDHASMREAYRSRAFADARQRADALMAAAPERLRELYKTLATRCDQLTRQAPSPDWDGIVDLAK